ncbi:MAG: hypothetical protein ACREDK_07140 [Thermoplasmata archaeon]
MTMAAPSAWIAPALALLLLFAGTPSLGPGAPSAGRPTAGAHGTPGHPAATNASALANFSASLQRLVTLVGVSGGALLALVWARVGIGWFSNDVTKKVQAKDRARDALVGSLVFIAAISGLVWALARWVITGA